MTDASFYRLTELDRTSWPEVRDQILRFEHEPAETTARSYPGYPRWPLDRVAARWWPSVDRVLQSRRSQRRLGFELPSRKSLSRVLYFAHGVHESLGRGPTPTAGGLQGIELYAVNFENGWLPPGAYHYDRGGHHLSQLINGVLPADWQAMVPSLPLVQGGSLLWVIVGDGERVTAKYGARGYRFLLLEAGHLMQNLCLTSTSAGCATVPLGAFFEAEIAKTLKLPTTDIVAYVGAAGVSA